MELSYLESIGMPILLREGDRPVTALKDIIVDPETGKIAALVTTKRDMIISPIDIVRWGKQNIVINDTSALVPTDSILRVATILNNGIFVYRNKVKTEESEYLGKVSDMLFSPKLFDIKKIEVEKKLLFITMQRYLIPLREVVEMKKEVIIVKNSVKKEFIFARSKKKKRAVAPRAA